MKKVLFLFFTVISISLFSQGGPKWSEDGNAVTSSSFLGTTNAESLFFRTNNMMRFYISASGDVVLPLLSSSANGFAVLDNSGKVIRINFTGNASDVFFGNGTFGSLSAATGWTTLAGKTFTNNKVGIGVSDPLQALEVNGNSIFNGSVSAQEFLVGDVTSSGKNLRISTNICLDGYDPSTGMRNELCVFTQPLYLNSKPGINYHTIINDGNTGNVGIGTNNPTAKLHVNGNFKVDGESFYNGTSHFSRISGMPGDSIIRFGDSTVILDHINNRIYAAATTGPGGSSLFFNKGLGLGSMFATAIGSEAVSIGKYTNAIAIQSMAIGNYLATITPPFTSGGKNIVIGSGVSSTQPLINGIQNSFMMGFNSTVPTFFIGPSAGAGTTGSVGIGTTDVVDKFQIKTDYHKFTIGNARFESLHWGTQYLGFNAMRTSPGTWKTETDGQHNGGAVIFSCVLGNMYFATIGDINEGPSGTPGDHTAITDDYIMDNTRLFIDGKTGNVAVGTTCIPSGFKLAVDGKIMCEELHVKLSDAAGCWPDYVYQPDYKLTPILDLEKYFIKNLHLPNFKSQKYYEDNGIDLIVNQKAIVKTLEEYSLYLIELKKENELMKEKIKNLEKQIKSK